MAVKSRYNLTCSNGAGEHLLYNTASGLFASLDDAAFAAYEACDAGACPRLSDAGFLIGEDIDELARVRAGFEAARDDASNLSIALAPTYACNCRCAYCYEQDKAAAKSMMTPEIVEAVYRFVEDRHAATGFSTLKIEWYGGDPSLALALIEEMSTRLMAWCEANRVAYEAMILTNGYLIEEEQAALLARLGVRSAYVTIDGPEEVHNYRRPAPGEDNPYESVKRCIRAFADAGIHVEVGMNADKVSLPLLGRLNAELVSELGVQAVPVKLNDYAHSYGTGRFVAPHFDLYTHDEFAVASFEAQKASGFIPGQIRAQLAPFPTFCQGQTCAYFVIDAFGDVYKCDGWMGDKSRSIFKLLEDEPVLDAITFDPFTDEDCLSCELLPLCMGNCSWERERCGWPCHPLKHTYADYLRAWREEFDVQPGGVTLLG